MKMLEKTSKTISTIAILWPVKANFEKTSATVEVDTFIFPVLLTAEIPCDFVCDSKIASDCGCDAKVHSGPKVTD